MTAGIVVDRAAIAREALEEITRPSDVGELVSESTEDDGTITVLFQATMPGYPGWHWTVSLAHLPDEDPTVLEAELLPGEGALLAPEWVPWSDRLDEWRAQQAADSADADEDDSDDEDGDDDAAEDFGDDVYDGLDPESVELDELAALPSPGLANAGVDEAGDPEGDADDDRPEPEAVPAGQ